MGESFLDLADITYLTPENATFSRTANGFPALRAFLPPLTDDLTEEKLPPEWQDFGRVQFHRAFPFDAPDEYISVLNKDGKELGIIRVLSDFAGEAKEIIQKELEGIIMIGMLYHIPLSAVVILVGIYLVFIKGGIRIIQNRVFL